MGRARSPSDEMGMEAPSQRIKLNHVKNPLNHSTPPGTNNPLEPSPGKSSGKKVDENPGPETEIIVTYQKKNPALEARIKVLVEKVDQGWRCGECGMENKHKFPRTPRKMKDKCKN